jgi:hypothetical protein
MSKRNENAEIVKGEVIGHRVDFLPEKIRELTNQETGKTYATHSLLPRVNGITTVIIEEEGQFHQVTANCDDFTESFNDNVNWESTRVVRSRIYKAMVKAVPYGATVELRKVVGRDRPRYFLDIEKP